MFIRSFGTPELFVFDDSELNLNKLFVMSASALKEKIYEAVGSIEDTERLQAILTMTTLRFRLDENPLTNEEMSLLEERKAEYLKGEAEPIPWRESISKARATYGL